MTPVFDLRRLSVLGRASTLKSTVIPRSQSDTTHNGLASLKLTRRGSEFAETMTIHRSEEKENKVEVESEDEEEESTVILRPLQISSDPAEMEKNSLLYRRLSRAKVSPKSPSSIASSRDVSRSQSMKYMRKNTLTSEAKRRYRGSSIPNEVLANGAKVQHRTVSNRSLPLPGEDINYTRLRNFSITSKGVVNRGDSFRSNGSREAAEMLVIRKAPSTNSCNELPSQTTNNSPAFKVLLIGALDVGKTSLKNQFMTSEYICSYDGIRDEANAVNIVLNNEESKLEFEEEELLEENDCYPTITEAQADAYVIIYSVTNRRSYLQVRRFLHQILSSIDQKAVILVGNKTDLVRLRTVTTEEGRSLAKDKGCKFIETSVAINHQVDELLVGVLTQIRMKKQLVEKQNFNKHKRKDSSNRKSSMYPGTKASGVLKKILQRACLKSKSCDNLHVL